MTDWQQVYETSEIVAGLIPQLTVRSLRNSDRQEILSRVAGFASDAAAAALHIGKKPFIALKFLERGRGVLATSLEDIRADIVTLEEKYPELANRFASLGEQLGESDQGNYLRKPEEPTWTRPANRRYEMGNDFDNLIAEIREKPEFNDFLNPPNELDTRQAAAHGPIVFLNTSELRCDAILIETHQIRSVPLQDLHLQDIRATLSNGILNSPQVLEWLWHCIADPILRALGFTQRPSENKWPRVWWIPTGLLTKFPIHAAGIYKHGCSDRVLDRVISSYNSSVKAIVTGRRRPVSAFTPHQALLVAMEHTPGSSHLPFAPRETAAVRDLFRIMSVKPLEPGCNKKDILSHLLQCEIFHFAGHGCTDRHDPSKSHLVLEDGQTNPLTVANLLEINLRKHSPFLAYLSACGTGQIHSSRFIDESIHLISGFQLAGFRHVIGTLWEVEDMLCVEMAKMTYEGMRDSGMSDESVAWGLHKAAKVLRDRWLTEQPMARPEDTSVGNAIEVETRDERLPRDVILCDGDITSPPYWIPYIHVGV